MPSIRELKGELERRAAAFRKFMEKHSDWGFDDEEAQELLQLSEDFLESETAAEEEESED